MRKPLIKRIHCEHSTTFFEETVILKKSTGRILSRNGDKNAVKDRER